MQKSRLKILHAPPSHPFLPLNPGNRRSFHHLQFRPPELMRLEPYQMQPFQITSFTQCYVIRLCRPLLA